MYNFLNNTYNLSFYGSTLWNHFSPESTYNRSIKLMGNLNIATHRSLIPIIHIWTMSSSPNSPKEMVFLRSETEHCKEALTQIFVQYM